VVSGSTISVYFDGTFDNSEAITGTKTAGTNYVVIGARTTTPTYAFNGTIDEVRIFNRALSPEEINASYNNG